MDKVLENIKEAVVVTLKVLCLYVKAFLLMILPRQPKSLDGEVILITGSANGVGKAICKRLASTGATLVLWDISGEANEKTAEELRRLGAKEVHTDIVDISLRSEIIAAAARLRSVVGSVTILVNNAGVAPIRPLLDTSSTTIQKTFDINVLAHCWTLQEFLPDMLAKNKGHVVTISSFYAKATLRGSSIYCATKHALDGLVECVKSERDYLKCCDNVKFTTVYPFFIKTRMVDEETTGLRLKFRFPFFTPFMDVDWTANKIVEGIRYEKEYVYLPWFYKLLVFARGLTPPKVEAALNDFLVEELRYPRSTDRMLMESN